MREEEAEEEPRGEEEHLSRTPARSSPRTRVLSPASNNRRKVKSQSSKSSAMAQAFAMKPFRPQHRAFPWTSLPGKVPYSMRATRPSINESVYMITHLAK